MTSPDVHMLTGAYAANALADTEREQFEAHLSECEECTQEVRDLLETTALLGVAAAAPVPPQLRDRVMAEVARTRQIPPVVSPPQTTATPRDRMPRPWGRRLALAAAACLAVFAVGLGTVTYQVYRDAQRAQQLTDRIAAVLTSPDARTATVSSDGSTATVVVSRHRSEIVFLARGLPGAPDRRTYQLWMIGPAGPKSAGLLGPSAAAPLILRGPADAHTLGVTVEPAGGSLQPTTEPVLLLPLPRA